MRIEIGFGVGFDATGKALDAVHVREATKMILVEASRVFGGCNILAGQGAWINGAGDLVVEESRTLVVNSALDDVEAGRKLAEFIRRVLRQESVAFAVYDATAEFLAEVR